MDLVPQPTATLTALAIPEADKDRFARLPIKMREEIMERLACVAQIGKEPLHGACIRIAAQFPGRPGWSI